MKIIVAPDSFKECLSAAGVAQAITEGLQAAWASVGPAGEPLEVVAVPMADGGEGTVETLLAATGGQRRTVTVTGPLGEPVQAMFGMLADGVGLQNAMRTLPLVVMVTAGVAWFLPTERRMAELAGEAPLDPPAPEPTATHASTRETGARTA